MFESATLSNYTPTRRFTNGELETQIGSIIKNKQLVSFVESISQMVLILNKYRQVVYANKSYKEFARQLKHNHRNGIRPGEAFNCANAFKSRYGCGTSDQCKTCGAFNAIGESYKGIKSTKDCQILTIDNDALDLQVTATPIEIENESLTIFSIIDISDEKRRKLLERVFIHDILNSAGGIAGLSTVLKEIEDKEMIIEIAADIENAANILIEEIKTQREIGAAERGDLIPEPTTFESDFILKELTNIYTHHNVNTGKPVSIHPESKNCDVHTDPVLLKRILGNMIKNALEVNHAEDEITVKCEPVNQKNVRFSVHNKSLIPEDIQHQLFKRFFSTKGTSRGIGTYSMKLLGEKYLKGKVWFESSMANQGTTFFIEL